MRNREQTELQAILAMLPSLLLTLLGLLVPTLHVSALNDTNSTSPLELGPINFASYDNYVYRDDLVAAQVVLTANASTRPARLIVAFPKGNTGILTYFVPEDGQELDVSTELSTLGPAQGENNQTGLRGNLRFNKGSTLGVTLIGSIRTVRDYTEGSGLTNEIFNYTLGAHNDSSVQLVRNWINGTTVQYLSFRAEENAKFEVTPQSNITIPPVIRIQPIDAGQNLSITFSTTFNYTDEPQLSPGLTPTEIFLTEPPEEASTALRTVLQGLKTGNRSEAYREQVKEVSFLTYEKEFLAGGWRFLTCESQSERRVCPRSVIADFGFPDLALVAPGLDFGRDTLLALRLLLPIMTPTASEAVLGAVLERINSTGAVCHEETVSRFVHKFRVG